MHDCDEISPDISNSVLGFGAWRSSRIKKHRTSYLRPGTRVGVGVGLAQNTRFPGERFRYQIEFVTEGEAMGGRHNAGRKSKRMTRKGGERGFTKK